MIFFVTIIIMQYNIMVKSNKSETNTRDISFFLNYSQAQI